MLGDFIQFGDFTLNSGTHSKWKLECDNLTDGEIEGLVVMIKEMVGEFETVEGVPTGGLRLAKAMGKYATRCGGFFPGPHLIVDDVLTTGGSMVRTLTARGGSLLRVIPRLPDGAEVKGAVIFARGPCPEWIRPVFQMPECFWLRGGLGQ